MGNTVTDRTTVNILHQNVCGITSKKDEYDLYLLHMNMDFVCITEHFLNKTNVNLFNLNGYKMVSKNVRIKKKRGGSMILCKNDRVVEDFEVVNKLYKMDCFEICCVKDINTSLFVCCCYRTPDGKKFDRFLERLEKVLEYFFKKKCVICGDFNVDLLVEDKQRTEYLTLLKCYNFRPLVTDITFTRNDMFSCLDNILTNIDEYSIVNPCKVDHNGLSDGHGALLCSLSLGVVKVNRKVTQTTISQRIYNKKNNEIFKQEILRHDWYVMGIVLKKNLCHFQRKLQEGK